VEDVYGEVSEMIAQSAPGALVSTVGRGLFRTVRAAVEEVERVDPGIFGDRTDEHLPVSQDEEIEEEDGLEGIDEDAPVPTPNVLELAFRVDKDAMAARGIVSQLHGVPYQEAFAAVKALGSRQAMTFMMSTRTIGTSGVKEIQTVEELVATPTVAVPTPAITIARRRLRDYWQAGGLNSADRWSTEELEVIRMMCTDIDQLRGREQGDKKSLATMINRGPYATLEGVDTALRMRGGGPAAWLAAQASVVTGGMATAAPGCFPPDPPWDPGEPLEWKYDNVTITTNFDADATSVIMTHDGKFASTRLFSTYQMPIAPVAIRNAQVAATRYVVNRASRLTEACQLVTTLPAYQVLIPPVPAVLDSLVQELSTHSARQYKVCVSGTDGLARVLTRLHGSLVQRDRANEGRARAKGEKPPEPSAGTLPSHIMAATVQSVPGQGKYSNAALATASVVCLDWARAAPNRADYVSLVDSAYGFANMVDLNQLWDCGPNHSLWEVLADEQCSAWVDSPQLNPEAAKNLALGGEVKAIGARLPQSLIGAWRDRFMGSVGADRMMAYANKLRVILDDEASAVDMASRVVMATGDMSPMEYVRSRIGLQFRGCGDRHCWCDEAVHTARDWSRSSGGAASFPRRARCMASTPSDTLPWITRAMWKAPSPPVNAVDRLVQTPACVSVEDMRSIVDEVVLTPSSLEDYPEQMTNIQLGGMPINCTLRMAAYALTESGIPYWTPKCNAAPQMQCAFVLWSASLSPHLRSELERYGMHRAPLKAWMLWEQECGTLIRRCAMVGTLKGNEWLQLRRVGPCAPGTRSGRTMRVR